MSLERLECVQNTVNPALVFTMLRLNRPSRYAEACLRKTTTRQAGGCQFYDSIFNLYIVKNIFVKATIIIVAFFLENEKIIELMVVSLLKDFWRKVHPSIQSQEAGITQDEVLKILHFTFLSANLLGGLN